MLYYKDILALVLLSIIAHAIHSRPHIPHPLTSQPPHVARFLSRVHPFPIDIAYPRALPAIIRNRCNHRERVHPTNIHPVVADHVEHATLAAILSLQQ